MAKAALSKQPASAREFVLRKQVAKLKASLLLHDRMGKIQVALARQWQTVFDAITDPLVVVDVDGKIVQCNRAMGKFLNRAPMDLIGSTCWEVLHGKSDRSENCLMLRMDHRKKGQCRESACHSRDGHKYKICLDPLTDEKGRLVGGIHIITQIKKTRARRAPRKASA